METKIDDQIIDKYLRNELKGDELAQFEEQLKNDPNLANEVSLRYDIMIGIRAAEQKSILAHLSKIKVKNREQAFADANTNRNYTYGIGIGVVVLLIAYLIYKSL